MNTHSLIVLREGKQMKITWMQIIWMPIVSFVLGLIIYLVPAITVSIAEARATNGSGQIVFTGFISAAGGSYLAADPAPDISLSPESNDWGNLWVGFSDAEEVTITNGGTDVLNISAVTLSDTENFSFIGNAGNDPCGDVPITIEAGTSCTCRINFHPQSEAAYGATLSIDSDDPDTPTADIALTGTGVPNDFPFGDGNFSVNVDSGCSIVRSGGDSTDGLGAYGLLILSALWFGIWRKRKE
jgi:hypothetical protein